MHILSAASKTDKKGKGRPQGLKGKDRTKSPSLHKLVEGLHKRGGGGGGDDEEEEEEEEEEEKEQKQQQHFDDEDFDVDLYMSSPKLYAQRRKAAMKEKKQAARYYTYLYCTCIVPVHT
jgi:hypothetical protein